MERLDKIANSSELEGKRVIITGCGYKPARTTFFDIVTGENSADYITVDGQKMKVNIGTAIAGVLAKKSAKVHMVSASESKLQNIKREFEKKVGKEIIEYSSLDLLDEYKVREFIQKLPKDQDLYWVQSVGLGAGSYVLKDENPYLPLEDIPIELLEKESQIVLRSTHLMMKEILPIFKFQKESRIAVISSMSAIRGYSFGGTHCAAKGAISRYTNSAMLGLYKKRVFVTDVRPGAIDTGMYDGFAVKEAIQQISDEYNGLWHRQITLAPPISVGEAVAFVLTTTAHITSLNLVAKGQFPNEGS